VRRAVIHARAQDGWLDPITWTLHGLGVAYGRYALLAAQRAMLPEDERSAALRFLLSEMRKEAQAMGANLAS
jgi:hypothetical protein